MTLAHRRATEADLIDLAVWNQQLIQDEGHTNPATLDQLVERLRVWLDGDYQAILFSRDEKPCAYALFREDVDEMYLRQFFVARDHRRQGVGRRAMELLVCDVWPSEKGVLVDVLSHNHAGAAFWKAIGFTDYCVTMKRPPSSIG